MTCSYRLAKTDRSQKIKTHPFTRLKGKQSEKASPVGRSGVERERERERETETETETETERKVPVHWVTWSRVTSVTLDALVLRDFSCW